MKQALTKKPDSEIIVNNMKQLFDIFYGISENKKTGFKLFESLAVAKCNVVNTKSTNNIANALFFISPPPFDSLTNLVKPLSSLNESPTNINQNS